MSVKITANKFEFGAQGYFRGNAHLVELGTYGEKKDPIGARAYVDPQNKVKREYLVDRVKKGQPVAVDWSRTTKGDLEVNGPIHVFGLNLEASATFSYEKVKTSNL